MSGKPDVRDFINGAKVQTRYKLISRDRLCRDERPTQAPYRLRGADREWLENNVKGYDNFAAAQIFSFGIAALKEKLVKGDFDVRDLVWPLTKETKK